MWESSFIPVFYKKIFWRKMLTFLDIPNLKAFTHSYLYTKNYNYNSNKSSAISYWIKCVLIFDLLSLPRMIKFAILHCLHFHCNANRQIGISTHTLFMHYLLVYQLALCLCINDACKICLMCEDKEKTRLSFVGVGLGILTTPHPITFLIFTAPFIWPTQCR